MSTISSRTYAVCAGACLSLFGTFLACRAQADVVEGRIRPVVDRTVKALMTENDVAGMAVGVSVDGRRFIFNYGLADKEKATPVTADTLFEIGSVSKTLTATLGAYAEAKGTLAFSDAVSEHLRELAGSAFDHVTVLETGTYTAGGLPLQFPDKVINNSTLTRYFREWRPGYEPGTYRVYSNPSIGLFGFLAAASLKKPFPELMEGTLFPALGLTNSYIRVPEAEMGDYAFGYNKANNPVRVTPGALDAQAYGVKTTAADLLRFVEANIDPSGLEPLLQKAIGATQTGYYRTGDMFQSLGWELYAWPAALDTLLAGNSSDMAMKPHAVAPLVPPQKPAQDVFFNKTGSTGGFGTYAAFVPTRRIGVVLLANRNYPIPERIKAAYSILAMLEAVSQDERHR
ncbi:beta-lactamase class C [Rhizobium mongolense subsp. loessense]|uniref:Beta-lactamase n=1 Tax=Rhizobium mongolense subsp. loessense TaxID=158890 RepID=A0A1G4TBD2_9HYPH|nr:beta-lactamase class C [Rhizobium mongolense subsp. loessense]